MNNSKRNTEVAATETKKQVRVLMEGFEEFTQGFTEKKGTKEVKLQTKESENVIDGKEIGNEK